MADERLLIQLSAYLDGELDPAARATVEAALEKNPDLKRLVTKFERLTRDTVKLPVPNIDDVERFRALASRTTERDSAIETRLKRAVAKTPAPHLALEKFDRVWENVLSRTMSPAKADADGIQRSAQFDGEGSAVQATSNEQRAWRKLDAAAAAIAVPAVPEVAWSETFHEIAQQTVRVNASERRSLSRLDQVAASLNAPRVSDEAFAKAWQNIAARTVGVAAKSSSHETRRMDGEPAVPPVSDKQWKGVWSGIESRIADKKPADKPAAAAATIPAQPFAVQTVKPASAPRPASNVVQAQAQFSASRRGKWHPWRWAAIGVMAAGVIAAFMIAEIEPPKKTDGPVAMEVPEALDDRYRVVVKYVEGQSDPVFCYVLKKDAQPADPEK